MAILNVDEKIVLRLKARAAAEGVSVEELLLRLLDGSKQSTKSRQPLSVEELDHLLESECTEGPLLPQDFARADLYIDHD